MPSATISLNISAEQYLDWYKGTARSVLARSLDGLTIQFPASALQQFVTKDGVHGLFRLTYNDEHRFVSLERVDAPSGFDRLA